MTTAPLGDQGVLCTLADEAAAARFAAAVRVAAPPWLFDVVPAYATVGVFFDPDRTDTAAVARWLRAPRKRPPAAAAGKLHTVPVCYDFPLDLDRVVEHTGLAAERVVELHLSKEYAVYAVGFVPGFPYLGYLPDELAGVPRLAEPRVRVEPGSVGLAGRQTGVYPLPRPGGWHLIGKTPLVLVDVADGFFPIRVGDRVRFTRIDAAEYRRREGERLGG